MNENATTTAARAANKIRAGRAYAAANNEQRRLIEAGLVSIEGYEPLRHYAGGFNEVAKEAVADEIAEHVNKHIEATNKAGDNDYQIRCAVVFAGEDAAAAA